MIEKAILDAEDYPTRTELWKSLPKQVQYQTFKRVLDYLEASGKITFDDGKIIYTGTNNPKLRALIESSIERPTFSKTTVSGEQEIIADQNVRPTIIDQLDLEETTPSAARGRTQYQSRIIPKKQSQYAKDQVVS